MSAVIISFLIFLFFVMTEGDRRVVLHSSVEAESRFWAALAGFIAAAALFAPDSPVAVGREYPILGTLSTMIFSYLVFENERRVVRREFQSYGLHRGVGRVDSYNDFSDFNGGGRRGGGGGGLRERTSSFASVSSTSSLSSSASASTFSGGPSSSVSPTKKRAKSPYSALGAPSRRQSTALGMSERRIARLKTEYVNSCIRELDPIFVFAKLVNQTNILKAHHGILQTFREADTAQLNYILSHIE